MRVTIEDFQVIARTHLPVDGGVKILNLLPVPLQIMTLFSRQQFSSDTPNLVGTIIIGHPEYI